ncbi:MAG: serine O-acetyltransferase [Bacteroidota bacterium]
MDSDFIKEVYKMHEVCTQCPSASEIKRFFRDFMGILFPDFANTPVGSLDEFNSRIQKLKSELGNILNKNALPMNVSRESVIDEFFDAVPVLYDKLQKDIDATFEGDPAANSREEIVRCYPGFYAVSAYRVAHLLLNLGVLHVPRVITEHAHNKTGIDIHPGAKIGEHFCIDHGTGVVIGETTDIGDYVKIYQGVTLGALSVNKEDAKTKRHPTIENHVVLYAGATILGGNTTVGEHSIIGGNVWLTSSVPTESKIYYQARMHNEDNDQPDMIIFK